MFLLKEQLTTQYYIARMLWLLLLSPMHCQIMLRWVISCRHFTSVSKAAAPNIKFWFKRTRYFCSLIVEFPINLLNCWVPYHLSWNHESLERYFPPLIWLERASECWCVQWNQRAVTLIVKPMNIKQRSPSWWDRCWIGDSNYDVDDWDHLWLVFEDVRIRWIFICHELNPRVTLGDVFHCIRGELNRTKSTTEIITSVKTNPMTFMVFHLTRSTEPYARD